MSKGLWILAASMLVVMPVGAENAKPAAPAAPQYYQYDPAKLTALEREKCEGIVGQLKLIDRKMQMEQRPWERQKMEEKQGQLFQLYVRWCKSEAVRAK